MAHPRGSTTPEGGNNRMKGDNMIPLGGFLLERGGMTTPEDGNIFSEGDVMH